MSLINKMLQDLEERQTGTDALGPMQGYVRAAPEASSRKRLLWPVAISLGAAAAAAAAGIWWMNSQEVEAPAMPAAQPIAQAPSLSLKLDHLPPRPLTETLEKNPADSYPAGLETAQQSQFESGRPAEPDNLLSAQKSADPVSVASLSTTSPAAPARAGEALEKPADTVAAAGPGRAMNESKRTRPEAGTAATHAKSPPSGQEHSTRSGSADTMAEAEAIPVKVSKQVKELTPAQRAENEYRHALSLVEQEKSKEAMASLEAALQLDAGHGAARQALAALLLEAKRPEDAMRKLSEGLATDKAQLGLAMMLARLQVDRQEARMAIETLQRSLPHALERADYRAFLGALLQREARHKEAIEHYAAALRKTPNNGIWWMGAGISLQAENRIPEARDAFSRAKMSGALSPDLLAFVEQKLAQLR